MSMQYFPLFIWAYVGVFWWRFSLINDRFTYTDAKKNQHCVLFGILTVVTVLACIVYREINVPFKFAYAVFWIICTVDIIHQCAVFTRAYEKSGNPYVKYRYDSEKRFMLRLVPAVSIVAAAWIMTFLI